MIFAEKSYSIEYPWIKKNRTVLNMPRVGFSARYEKQPEKVFTVGYMGEIAEKRGSITTLKALGILREKQLPFISNALAMPNLGMKKNSVLFLKKLGIGGNVNFRGYMQNENGLKIMAECNVGLAVLRAVPNNINSSFNQTF